MGGSRTLPRGGRRAGHVGRQQRERAERRCAGRRAAHLAQARCALPHRLQRLPGCAAAPPRGGGGMWCMRAWHGAGMWLLGVSDWHAVQVRMWCASAWLHARALPACTGLLPWAALGPHLAPVCRLQESKIISATERSAVCALEPGAPRLRPETRARACRLQQQRKWQRAHEHRQRALRGAAQRRQRRRARRQPAQRIAGAGRA